jgi:glutathione peroxidase-family protein
MKSWTLAIVASTTLGLAGARPALAAAIVGQPAPDFSLADDHGASHSLSALKGKYVVLEWVNYDCPFVQKHYKSGNLPGLQREYTAKGVVWLSINSSAPGKQGNYPPAEIDARAKGFGAAFTAYLVDSDGRVGREYGAKTTPHMFVIDPAGTLIYEGGIDDTPSTDIADLKTATNYVRAALDEALAGQPVRVTTSRPYGCSVKY